MQPLVTVRGRSGQQLELVLEGRCTMRTRFTYIKRRRQIKQRHARCRPLLAAVPEPEVVFPPVALTALAPDGGGPFAQIVLVYVGGVGWRRLKKRNRRFSARPLYKIGYI